MTETLVRDVTYACDVTLVWSKSAGLGAKVLDLAEKCWTWLKSAGLGWKALDLAGKFWTWPKVLDLGPNHLDLSQKRWTWPKRVDLPSPVKSSQAQAGLDQK